MPSCPTRMTSRHIQGVPGKGRNGYERVSSAPITVRMKCELLREDLVGSYRAALYRQALQCRTVSGVVILSEEVVDEVELPATVSNVFRAVDRWLRESHNLEADPASWRAGGIGPDAGVVMLYDVLPRSRGHDVGAHVTALVELLSSAHRKCSPVWLRR